MSVARMLGVDDIDGPMMRKARRRWPEWAAEESALRPVPDLLDLPAWTRAAGWRAKDDALLALARRGAVNGGDDEAATAALLWALLPGAVTLARRLRDMSPRIDELVAAQMWLEARTFAWDRRRNVATSILCETRRAVLLDLGAGAQLRRRDPAWAHTICLPPDDAAWKVMDRQPEAAANPLDELSELMTRATELGAISATDCRLLLDLAAAADRAATPARHGQGGLMAPAASEVVAEQWGINARTVRRRARRSIRRLCALSRSGLEDQCHGVSIDGHPVPFGDVG